MGSKALPERFEALPEGSEDLPEGSENLPEGSEGLQEGSEGLPERPARDHGWKDERTYGISPYFTILCPLSETLPEKFILPVYIHSGQYKQSWADYK